jgi:hypothetical protein
MQCVVRGSGVVSDVPQKEPVGLGRGNPRCAELGFKNGGCRLRGDLPLPHAK